MTTQSEALAQGRQQAADATQKEKYDLKKHNDQVKRIKSIKNTVLPVFQGVGLVIAIIVGLYFLRGRGMYVTEPEVTEARRSHAHFTVRNKTGIPKADPGFIHEMLLKEDTRWLADGLLMENLNTTGWPNDLKTEVNKWVYKNTTMNTTRKAFVAWARSNNWLPHYRKAYPMYCHQRWQARVNFFAAEKLKVSTLAEQTLMKSNAAGTVEHDRWHSSSAWWTLAVIFGYMCCIQCAVLNLDCMRIKLEGENLHIEDGPGKMDFSDTHFLY